MYIVFNQQSRKKLLSFWRWFKKLFFKNQQKYKYEPGEPITFTGLIKKADPDYKEFKNSSAVEHLTGAGIVPLTDLQQEVKEMSYFARKNNIQEDIWDGPTVYKAGEIIEGFEESKLRGVKTDYDKAVFGDEVEMVKDQVPKATYIPKTVKYADFTKQAEPEFDPNKFEFKTQDQTTRLEIIQFLQGHAVPMEFKEDFKRFGRYVTVTGGWSRWEWFQPMFESATHDTLYEVYLQLRVAQHKLKTTEFYGNNHSHETSVSS